MRAIAVERRRVFRQHGTQLLPGPALVHRAAQDATRRLAPVPFCVFPNLRVRTPAHRVAEEKSFHGPLERRRPAVDRIAEEMIERVERRIAQYRMVQPILHVPGVGIFHGPDDPGNRRVPRPAAARSRATCVFAGRSSGRSRVIRLTSRSSASARAKASGLISMTAFIAGPRLSIASMRTRYFSAIERAVNLPDFIPSWRAAIVISSKSNRGTRWAAALAD